ncbi:membrane protein [Aureibacter tunicatorum]|nr:membrane protein [Aureibacter tunicatorum]
MKGSCWPRKARPIYFKIDYAMSLDAKKQRVFLVLGAIFLTNAIIAEMIGVKIFSAEKTLGTNPANLKLLEDLVLDFNLSAGAVLWPVVFVTTDIINEYFGKEGVRKISFLTVGMIIYAFGIIYVVTELPPADFWIDVNDSDPSGNKFNIDYAFKMIFRQGLGIIIGSICAFLIGQLIDALVFHYLRRLTKNKYIWLRATGSTLVSQLIDSFVVLYIAFYVFGTWSMDMIVSVGIINYIYKFAVAIILTPLLYIAHSMIDSYLGKKEASSMVFNIVKKPFFENETKN